MKKLQRFENFNMGFTWTREEKINPKTRIEDFKREFKKIVDDTEEPNILKIKQIKKVL